MRPRRSTVVVFGWVAVTWFLASYLLYMIPLDLHYRGFTPIGFYVADYVHDRNLMRLHALGGYLALPFADPYVPVESIQDGSWSRAAIWELYARVFAVSSTGWAVIITVAYVLVRRVRERRAASREV